MTVFFIVLSALIIILILVLLYFFYFAFLKRKVQDTTDLDAPINNFLKPYRETVESGMKYIYEHPHTEVYTKSFDGLRLCAQYYPCGESKRTIIIFHGYRSSPQRDFSCAVKMYGEMGLNVLMVDQRSSGKSEGRLITFGIKESRDVLSWINFCLENFGKDIDIFLGGLSMGASTVLYSTALNLPKNVKAIVADCGFNSPAAIIKSVAAKSYGPLGVAAIPVINILCKIIGNFDIYSISTEQVLKNCDIPVIFIHGKADDFVPCEMSVKGYEAMKGEKRMVLIDNADHGMSFLTEPEKIKSELEAFLGSH